MKRTRLPQARVTAPDWVGIRLLFFALSTNASNMQVGDVRRAHAYYLHKYGAEGLQNAFNKLWQDLRRRKEWDNPFSEVIRNMYKQIHDQSLEEIHEPRG